MSSSPQDAILENDTFLGIGEKDWHIQLCIVAEHLDTGSDAYKDTRKKDGLHDERPDDFKVQKKRFCTFVPTEILLRNLITVIFDM